MAESCLRRLATLLALAVALAPSLASAHRHTAQDTAAAIVQAALAAMGGRARLEGLHSLRLDLRAVTYRIDDSERADGPPWINVGYGTEWRDEDGARSRVEIEDAGLQWTLPTVRLDDGHAMAVGQLWGGSWRWSAAPSFGDRLALSPERVLLTAAEAPDLHRVGDTRLLGQLQTTVAFHWRGLPVRLYIDKALHLPSRVSFDRGSPLDRTSAMLGDVHWRTDLLFWRPGPNGVLYPRQWSVFRDGQPASTTIVVGLAANGPPPPEGFVPPESARLDLPVAAAAAYDSQQIPRPSSGDLLQPLADNLWMIAGAWNVLVARQPDGLMVIEAPQSSGYSEQIIALLRARFPAVPIKGVISTTDSTWHIAGVRPYVANRTPVYALDANLAPLRRLIGNPRRLAPDRLARRPVPARLIAVTHGVVIGAGPTRLELLPIRGHGDARMLMVFAPGPGLLYGSSNDLSDASDKATFNTFELVARVKALGLPVRDYVGIHTTKRPWREVLNAVDGGEVL